MRLIVAAMVLGCLAPFWTQAVADPATGVCTIDNPAAEIDAFAIVNGLAQWHISREYETQGYVLEGANAPGGAHKRTSKGILPSFLVVLKVGHDAIRSARGLFGGSVAGDWMTVAGWNGSGSRVAGRIRADARNCWQPERLGFASRRQVQERFEFAGGFKAAAVRARRSGSRRRRAIRRCVVRALWAGRRQAIRGGEGSCARRRARRGGRARPWALHTADKSGRRGRRRAGAVGPKGVNGGGFVWASRACDCVMALLMYARSGLGVGCGPATKSPRRRP